jgi:hypothetical protein
VLWNQGVYNDRKVTANRQAILIKNVTKNMHTDRCGNGNGQERNALEAENLLKIQEFTFRDKSNVGHEMCDCTSSNWDHRNSNKKVKVKFGRRTGKHSVDSLQKTAVLGTSHTIRRVLQSEP